jgi:hypothetical protein
MLFTFSVSSSKNLNFHPVVTIATIATVAYKRQFQAQARNQTGVHTHFATAVNHSSVGIHNHNKKKLKTTWSVLFERCEARPTKF